MGPAGGTFFGDKLARNGTALQLCVTQCQAVHLFGAFPEDPKRRQTDCSLVCTRLHQIIVTCKFLRLQSHSRLQPDVKAAARRSGCSQCIGGMGGPASLVICKEPADLWDRHTRGIYVNVVLRAKPLFTGNQLTVVCQQQRDLVVRCALCNIS